MKKILPFFALLTSSCGNCEEISLLPEERAWFAPYPDGTQVSFRSNRGRSNTFTMRKRQEWHTNTDCNRLESGPYQPIFVQVVLTPAQPYPGQHQGFVLNMRKNHPDRPGYLQFDMAGLSCGTPALPGPPDYKLRPQPCTLADGRTFPAAYAFREGQNSTGYGNCPLRAFFWDQQAGLIRYELTNGEVFDLVP